MTGHEPLYIMVKPPKDKAAAIRERRTILGLSDSYDSSRFHSTMLPLGDAAHFTDAQLEMLATAVTSLEISPFEVRFDRLHNNALIGTGMKAYRRWQKALVDLLTSLGLPLMPYPFRPHISLAYGEPVNRTIPVDPVGWLVEQLLLVRSIHGKGQHVVMARWPLISRQFSFGF